MPDKPRAILSKTFRLLRRLASRLGVRVVLLASLSVVAVLGAELLRVFVHGAAARSVGPEGRPCGACSTSLPAPCWPSRSSP